MDYGNIQDRNSKIIERVIVSQTAGAGTIVFISQCKELVMNSNFSSILDSAETSIQAPTTVRLST
jgi:hypothetical protein